MLLIVSWHYATQFGEQGHGVLDEEMSVYHIFAFLIGGWGQLGVDLFVIISVYYLRQSNRFHIAKVLDLMLISVFYGLFWTFICYVFGVNLSITDALRGTVAIFTGENWFGFSYVLLYIFHPLLNCFIEKLSIAQLKKGTVLLTIFVSGIKTIYHGIPICDFMFMINIYFIICCLEKTTAKKWFVIHAKTGFVGCSLFLVIIHIVLVIIADYYNSLFLHTHSYYFNLRGSIFILFDALCLFYWFCSIKSIHSYIINSISSTCFGVFLSHQFVGYKFWYSILHRNDLTQVKECLHMAFSVIFIFIVCSFIDFIRQKTVGFLYKKCCSIPTLKEKQLKIDDYMNSTC